jgi:hypothetical protein
MVSAETSVCAALLLAEATNDYYRNIYADPLLGPIFRGEHAVSVNAAAWSVESSMQGLAACRDQQQEWASMEDASAYLLLPAADVKLGGHTHSTRNSEG